MQVTQTAMTQLQQIAATFVSDIPNLNGLNPVGGRQRRRQRPGRTDAGRRSVEYEERRRLRLRRAGHVPIRRCPRPTVSCPLASTPRSMPPFPRLAANGAAATTAATLTIARSNGTGTSPFSAYLSQPAAALSRTRSCRRAMPPRYRPGCWRAATHATSAGTSTTGSYMRDLMRALATLGSMSSSQVNDPGFSALVQDTGTSLNGVVTAMATDVGVLGNTPGRADHRPRHSCQTPRQR